MIYKTVRMIKEPISALGIGCWNFGGDWDTSDDASAINIIHCAIDHGINLIDVAPVYGWHHAERVLGKAIRGITREKVFIASKCGLVWNERHQTRNDLSRENILREIDESLARLDVEYIDLYQLHWPDHSTPIEETVDALRRIVQAGKIRYIGLSNFSQKDVALFMSMIDVHAQQGLYNMLERNAKSYHGIPLEYRTESEVFPAVLQNGQAFLPYSPFFQGLLAGEFTLAEKFSPRDIRNQNPKLLGEQYRNYFACYEKLRSFAREIARPMNELAINWLRQKPEVTSIIGGVSSVGQLEKNLRALDWEITAEQMEAIGDIIKPFEFV